MTTRRPGFKEVATAVQPMVPHGHGVIVVLSVELHFEGGERDPVLLLSVAPGLFHLANETGVHGLILLPILGLDSTLLHLDNRYDNETVAQTTLGLGLQTILFMIPVMVLVGWAAGIEGVDLLFSSFEVTVLFPAVLVVQASIEENEKGWLPGATLFSTYLTIAIAAWFQK